MMQTFTFKKSSNRSVNCLQTFEEAGVSDWVPLSGKIAIQITGSATSVRYMVERSVSDPLSDLGANPAPVEDSDLQGNPSSGMSPAGYIEPSTAWWRVRILSTDAPILVAISGAAGGVQLQ